MALISGLLDTATSEAPFPHRSLMEWKWSGNFCQCAFRIQCDENGLADASSLAAEWHHASFVTLTTFAESLDRCRQFLPWQPHGRITSQHPKCLAEDLG